MKDTGLVIYDRMCHAIAEAHRVDEVADIRHKAMALERYAAQAANLDAEVKAREVRLRAERRAGQLLKELKESGERATQDRGGANIPTVSQATTPLPTLRDFGISRDQSSKWQKLAEVPEADFEAALADPENRPSTELILRKANGDTTPVATEALALVGTLRDFEERRIITWEADHLVAQMTAPMQADCRRLLPIVAQFLSRLSEALSHE